MSIRLVIAASLGLAFVAPSRDEWLEEEVHFVISSRERARFEELRSDEERDRFIEIFWEARSISEAPMGSGGIAAREAHRRRLDACDRLFGEGALRGRFTERGRIYQNLGPPAFRETFGQSGSGIVASELWHYAGVSLSPLPDSFYLLFFRARGDVRYRLWSPVADGLEALLPDAEPNRFQMDSERERLASIDPELAIALRGLTRGGDSVSVSLLATLADLPDLLERRRTAVESVRAHAGFRTIDARLEAVLLDDDAGVAEVHYALQVPASEIVGEPPPSPTDSKGRGPARIVVEGRLFGEGAELDRWEDALELRRREGAGSFTGILSVEGRRVAVPGATRLVATLIGGGTASGSSTTVLSRLYLARSVRSDPSIPSDLPFRVGDFLASPLAGNVVSDALTLAVLPTDGSEGRVEWTLRRDEEALWKSTDERQFPFTTTFLPLHELPPGDYRIEAASAGARYEKTFEWRPGAEPTEWRVLARERRGAEEAGYRYRRAASFRSHGERERAIGELEKAVASDGENLPLQLELATLRYAAGRYEEVVEQLARSTSARSARDDSEIPLDIRLDLLVLQAGASEALGRFERAVALYEEAVRLAPENAAYAASLSRARGRAAESLRRDR